MNYGGHWGLQYKEYTWAEVYRKNCRETGLMVCSQVTSVTSWQTGRLEDGHECTAGFTSRNTLSWVWSQFLCPLAKPDWRWAVLKSEFGAPKYCKGFDQSVAEQRLGKQTATIEEKLLTMWSAPSKRTLPGNAAVNMHTQQWETVFSVRSVQRSYLEGHRRCSTVLGRRQTRDVRIWRRVNLWIEHFMCAIVQWDWECIIQCDFHSSRVINPLPGSG
jgi:hypothetical protein